MKAEMTIDGGISFNPGGEAYGSFEFEGEIYQRKFGGGHGHTNNTAEAQIAAESIEWLAETISRPDLVDLVIHTDSQLLCNWINMGKNPRTGQVAILVRLLERFRQQAKAFRSVRLEWQPRELSVAVLGH